MRRRLIITTVWVAGTIVAIALSVSAVGMVGHRVAGRDSTLVSPAGVEQALADTTTTSQAPDAPGENELDSDESGLAPEVTFAEAGEIAGASDVAEPQPPVGSASNAAGAGETSPQPSAVDEVYVTSGGTVGVRCSGLAISLLYATPAPGWAIHGSANTGPVEVEVRFEPSEDPHGEEARVKVACQAGVPVEEIREND